MKEHVVSVSVNKVLLMGRVGKCGFSVKFLPSGSAVASGSITIAEPCKDGRVFETFFPVEVYGSKAEAASELKPGIAILVDGRLGRRKNKSGEYEVIVSCYAVQALVIGQTGVVVPAQQS